MASRAMLTAAALIPVALIVAGCGNGPAVSPFQAGKAFAIADGKLRAARAWWASP